LRAILEDLLALEEPPRDELFEADFEPRLREALEPLRLADEPFEAPFPALLFPPLDAAFLGAAFFGAAFLIPFFMPPFFAAAFLGAALFIAFFGAALFIAFLAAFLGALLFGAAFFIPLLVALFDSVLPLRPELLEDFDRLRLEELLLALFDEDLPPPGLLEADFLVAAFFVDFAILMGFE
jgi:hypothetical protein